MAVKGVEGRPNLDYQTAATRALKPKVYKFMVWFQELKKSAEKRGVKIEEPSTLEIKQVERG